MLTGPNEGYAIVVSGAGGDDMLNGKIINATITGNGGNDTLIGGFGNDTAVFNGNMADYEFSYQSNGQIIVHDLNLTNGNDGTDTLSGIELASFVDGNIAIMSTNEFRVNASTIYSQQAPAIAVLPDGGFVVSWMSYGQDEINDSQGVYAQRYAANGAPVGGEFRVNSTTVSDQSYSSITALSDGGFVVTWLSLNQDDGSSSGIYAQRYTANGTPVGSEFPVNSATVNGQYYPTIAALSDGGFVVSWESYLQDGSGYGIYAQRYAADGTPSSDGEIPVNSTKVNSQQDPTIAALTNGGFVVSWASYNQDGSGWGIYAQRYAANGQKIDGEFLVNSDNTAGDQIHPSIAALSNGGFVIGWQSPDGDGDGIYAQRYDADGQKVNYSSGFNNFYQFRVNNNTTGSQNDPMISALPNGGFVTSWTSYSQDGSVDGIYAQRYTANSEQVGGQFRVNSTPATNMSWSKPGQSAISTLPDGGFVVSWQALDGFSDNFTNKNYGIYAQRYAANGQKLDYPILSGSAGNDQINMAENLTTRVDLLGYAGNDILQGGAGNDAVDGGEGDDILIGNQGNDALIGGSGNDKAGFSGSHNEYKLTVSSNGQFVITDINVANGDDGTDTLSEIEKFQFSTGDFTVLIMGSEFKVNSETLNDQTNPAIEALADGGFIISWESSGQDGNGKGIYAQRYDSSGEKSGTELKVNTYTAADQIGPAITALNDGGYLVTWFSYKESIFLGYKTVWNGYTWITYPDYDSSYGIYGQLYNANGTVRGSEFQLNQIVYKNQTTLTVTVLSNDTFVAAWQSTDQDGSGEGIYARIFNANGTAKTSEFRVNTETLNDQTDPAIEALADGGFIISWESSGQDGSGKGIYAQRYDSSGAKFGTEFKVNSYTNGDQIDPAITALNNGGYLVTWASFKDFLSYSIPNPPYSTVDQIGRAHD